MRNSEENKSAPFTKEELKMIHIIRERAKYDIDFREKLLANPEEAFKEYSEFEKKSDSE